MSNQFGRAAINAAHELQKNAGLSPETAWINAISKETTSSTVINKPCTKATFISLCYLGKIKDVTVHGNYDSVEIGYLQKLFALIAKDANVLKEPEDVLWSKVSQAGHQSQLAIVKALMAEDLLVL